MTFESSPSSSSNRDKIAELIPGSTEERRVRQAAQEGIETRLKAARFRPSANYESFSEKASAYELAGKLDQLPEELMEDEESFYRQWQQMKEDSQREQKKILEGYKADAKARELALRQQILEGRVHVDEDPMLFGELQRDAAGKVIGIYDNVQRRMYGATPESPAGRKDKTSIFSAAEIKKAQQKSPAKPPGALARAADYFKNLFT